MTDAYQTTLYTLTGAAAEAVATLESLMNDTGLTPEKRDELVDAAFAELKRSCDEIEVKLRGCRDYILSEQADIKSIKAEIERLTERKRFKENAVERFKEYVKRELEKLADSKISRPTWSLVFSKEPDGKVEITDEQLLSKAYWRKPDPEIDKAKVKADLKAGVVVMGARLVPVEKLTIK